MPFSVAANDRFPPTLSECHFRRVAERMSILGCMPSPATARITILPPDPNAAVLHDCNEPKAASQQTKNDQKGTVSAQPFSKSSNLR